MTDKQQPPLPKKANDPFYNSMIETPAVQDIIRQYQRHIEPTFVEDYGKFVSEHLIGSTKDTEALILKMHLLIEYALNLCINKLAFTDEITNEKHFMFLSKVKVCQALGIFQAAGKHKVLDEIFAINSIRNELAHGLARGTAFDKKQLEKLLPFHPELLEPSAAPSDWQIIHEATTMVFTSIITALDMRIAVNNELLNYPLDLSKVVPKIFREIKASMGQKKPHRAFKVKKKKH